MRYSRSSRVHRKKPDTHKNEKENIYFFYRLSYIDVFSFSLAWRDFCDLFRNHLLHFIIVRLPTEAMIRFIKWFRDLLHFNAIFPMILSFFCSFISCVLACVCVCVCVCVWMNERTTLSRAIKNLRHPTYLNEVIYLMLVKFIIFSLLLKWCLYDNLKVFLFLFMIISTDMQFALSLL